MAEFIIQTVDNDYSYTSTIPVGTSFESENNNKSSDTQGFLRKIQKGQYRWKVKVVLKVTKTNYESILVPMSQYPENVICEFDRVIPGKLVKEGTFVFEDIQLLQDFGDEEYEVMLELTEVIY